ncbi:MAG: PKD domain-containing protein, partial [Planctomycetes bacterium]|nr:PKD domain-containing protein [Planctomycetota bacterium]
FLVSFGKEVPTHWGDDDYKQEILIYIPAEYTGDVFFHVFDPDCGGIHDEINEAWNTTTRFSILSGRTTELQSRSFQEDSSVDNRWVSIFNLPLTEGQLIGSAYLFAIKIEGGAGDDGNLYQIRVSSAESNMPIPDVVYTMEQVCFRQASNKSEVVELTFDPPLANETPVIIRAFDNDDPGVITLDTPARKKLQVRDYGNDRWAEDSFRVQPGESVEKWRLRIQQGPSLNNDMVIYVKDGQKDEYLPIRYPILLQPLNRAPEIQTQTAIDTSTSCQVIFFDATGTTDADGDQINYEWNFGDGTTGNGMKVSHRYTRPGHYQAMLTAIDNSITDCKISTQIIPVIINTPPVAEAGLNRKGCPGEIFQFDGSRSFDRDGRITNYEWDFGDGSTGQGKAVTHTYENTGIFKVRLKVTDDSQSTCNTAVDDLVVRINNPPIANAGPDQLTGRLTVAFDGTQSNDPEGESLIYIWGFGDGSPPRTGATPVHTYREPGTYLVSLTVRDRSSTRCDEDSDQMTVIINRPPNADPGEPQIGCTGESLNFDASNSKDRDGEIVSFSWNFGDGKSATGITANHLYDQPGIYTVTLTVDDNSATEASRDINVTEVRINVPPVAVASADPEACINGKINFDGSLSYDPDGDYLTYQWDFGDEQIGTGSSTVHYYTAPGLYTAKLTVRDGSETGCSETSTQIQVKINEPPVAVTGPDIFTCSSTVDFDGSQSHDPDGAIIE